MSSLEGSSNPVGATQGRRAPFAAKAEAPQLCGVASPRSSIASDTTCRIGHRRASVRLPRHPPESRLAASAGVVEELKGAGLPTVIQDSRDFGDNFIGRW